MATSGNARGGGILLFTVIVIILASPGYGEMYRWVDEKGTIHFVDDLSNIPEKYQPDAEMRKAPKESPILEYREKPVSQSPPSALKGSELQGFEVELLRRGEIWLSEVVLNGKLKQYFVVDTGASFTLINQQAARQLNLTIDENTPFIPVSTASSTILTPLVTLKSIRVGNAEVEDVDVLIHNLPSEAAGLLGNSFLNKFRVVLDSNAGKMTLFPMQGQSSADRPGGYGQDYWVGRFRFYLRVLADLKSLKTKYEGQGGRSDLSHVNNAIRYFENQLAELERKASFAGVPRNWRE